MVKRKEYQNIIVESYVPSRNTGLHGRVHIRPVNGQHFPTSLHVECSKTLSTDYPIGTKFRLRAKLTDREGGGEYLYSFHGWPVDVIDQ
jgi:hypothetical protein